VFSHYELGAIAALCCNYDCLAITDEVQPSFSSTLLFIWIKKNSNFFFELMLASVDIDLKVLIFP
jgi:hypothetical protein